MKCNNGDCSRPGLTNRDNVAAGTTQMGSGYVFYFTILLILLYSLLWTTTCQLGCRPGFAEDDGLSGLSGMVVPLNEPDNRVRDCVCESCPCALIDNFLKTLRPATRVCSTATEYIDDVWNMCYSAYDRIARIVECRTSCRRHAQFVNPTGNFNSNEDFTLVELPKHTRALKAPSAPKPSVSGAAKPRDALIPEKLPNKPRKLSDFKGSEKEPVFPLRSSESSSLSLVKSPAPPPKERKKSKDTDTPPKTPKVKEKKNKKIQTSATSSDETLKPSVSIADNCSKCVERGKICIKGCASAEEKRRQKKK